MLSPPKQTDDFKKFQLDELINAVTLPVSKLENSKNIENFTPPAIISVTPITSGLGIKTPSNATPGIVKPKPIHENPNAVILVAKVLV